MATEAELKEIKQRHSFELLRQPGVAGVGIEKNDAGDFALVVYVTDDEALARLPKDLDGAPVKYVRTDPFRKLD